MPSGVRISTVFLGLDNNHLGIIRGKSDTRPLLFETMIFGGPHHHYQRRSMTWVDAEIEHRRALALASSAELTVS